MNFTMETVHSQDEHYHLSATLCVLPVYSHKLQYEHPKGGKVTQKEKQFFFQTKRHLKHLNIACVSMLLLLSGILCLLKLDTFSQPLHLKQP